MIIQKKYSDVIERRFVQATHKKFSNGDGIFQHVFAPCHTSSKMGKESEELKINMRQCAAMYPGLNTIVNLGDIAKCGLGNM
jgi:hypothetical protein